MVRSRQSATPTLTGEAVAANSYAAGGA